MLKITKRLVFTVFCLCLAFGSQAQEEKKKEEEVKRVKMVVVDKEGKKHVLDETYTGEMPESLKKKIAEFKKKLKADGAIFTFDDSKHLKGLNLSDAATNGNMKIIVIEENGEKTMKVESIDGALPEEVKEKLAKLKEKSGSTAKVVIDIDSEELIEIDGNLHEDAMTGGQVIVKKDGKEVLNEKFEGKMPESLKAKLKELKETEGEEGNLEIEIKLEGGDGLGTDCKVIKLTDVDEDEIDVNGIKIKVDAESDGEPKIWILKNGEGVELKDADHKVEYKFELDEDGKILEGSSVFVFQVVHIEDIKANDKDIPEALRFTDQPKLEESISGLNFYPNPNNGNFKLNFKLEEQGNTAISIFDLNGKEIYQEQLNDFTGAYSRDISIQNQPKGLYILKISQGDKVLSKKLVIQ